MLAGRVLAPPQLVHERWARACSLCYEVLVVLVDSEELERVLRRREEGELLLVDRIQNLLKPLEHLEENEERLVV